MRSHAKAASVLVSLLILLGIVASTASAAPTATTAWVYQASFGTEIRHDNATQNGIAVEAGSGNILAPVGIFEEVRVFAPDASLGGTPLTQFSTPGYPSNISIDRETGAIYPNEGPERSRVWRYLSDGAPTPTYTLDTDFAPEVEIGAGSSAVDPTTNELLAVRFSTIRRFDPETGELISSFASLTSADRIAVGLDGTVYLTGFSGEIARYTPSGTPLLPRIPLPGPSQAIAVDPGTGDIAVVVGERLLGFTPGGEKIFDVPMQAGGSVGIALDPERNRLYNRNPFTQTIDTYVPAPYAGVDAPTVSEITPTGFHVSTEVDPGEKEGGGVPDESTVHFEYRLVGEESWASTPDQDVNGPGSFVADITGLSANRTYEVRAVASNSLTVHFTDPTKSTTAPVPPATETTSATDVTETSVVLNGTINPTGLLTSYHFEYGATTAYGSRIPAGIEAVAGGGYTTLPFFRTVTGLAPGTTYHYRLVATNSAGTNEGTDRTFTTVATGGIPVRAYEQVTPADKHGAAIIPSLGIQAAADGNGLSFTKKSGANASPIITRGLAIRGSSDWGGDIDLDPPINVGSGNFLVHPALAISDDFTRSFVSSDRALTPGAIEKGGNLYRVDLASGTYDLVGASSDPGAFDTYAYSLSAGLFRAGAPDFSWIMFVSPKPLLPGAPESALYRWSESDGLEVVSVTPDGEMTSTVRADIAPVYETVSGDGSRIYFTAVDAAEPGVFLREAGGAAKAISVSHVAGDPPTPQPATLLAVNEDGRYAFFSTPFGVKLTDDAPGEIGDLYRYDVNDDSLEYLGTKAFSIVNGSRLQKGSRGVSDDGRTFYFLSGDMGEGAYGEGPLMVWRDGAIHEVSPVTTEPGAERMSPDGRYYAIYQSSVVQQVGVIRLYDAETNQLECVSCLPDGTPVFASLPSNTGGDTLFSNRSPRSVGNDGAVYFDTAARLVAADVNGTRDVYVYRDGSVSLISPGNAPFDAVIGDVSASGSDVFFTTAQKLVGRDNDESIDVYDARVNGGLPAQSPPPPQECLRDDCKATPNAGPELPFGGSEALSGPGNVNPPKHKKCGKGKRAKKVEGKVRCVKKHKANKNKKGGNR